MILDKKMSKKQFLKLLIIGIPIAIWTGKKVAAKTINNIFEQEKIIHEISFPILSVNLQGFNHPVKLSLEGEPHISFAEGTEEGGYDGDMFENVNNQHKFELKIDLEGEGSLYINEQHHHFLSSERMVRLVPLALEKKSGKFNIVLKSKDNIKIYSLKLLVIE